MIDRDQKDWVFSKLLLANDSAMVGESAEQINCSVADLGMLCNGRKVKIIVAYCKLIVVTREGVAPEVKVEVIWQTMEIVNSFKHLLSRSSADGRHQEDVKMRVGERPNMFFFCAAKIMFNDRSINSDVKGELSE